jgi:glutamine synthetase
MGETYFHVNPERSLWKGEDMPAPAMKWNGNMNEGAIEGVSKLIRKNGIEIVDFKFNDLPGLWQHFSIPSSELSEIDDPMTSIWADGIGFDGSSIRGFQQIQESDMILIPDAATAVMDPICETPTASIICDVYDPLTKQPYTRDPRYIAKKA